MKAKKAKTEDNRMNSIFRYPGGKSGKTISDWILGHRPATIKEYREPFVGGGGIFFALSPKDVEKRWINDKNESLIAVYRALAERSDEFIKLCRTIPAAKEGEALSPARPDSKHQKAKGNAIHNARLLKVFNDFANDNDCDQALRYFFVNRTVWAGRVVYEQASRMYFSNHPGWNIAHTSKMEDAAKHLQGVRVTALDYSELLSAPGEDVWIYCDPPYVVNTNLTAKSRQYRYNFEMSDHEAFAVAVKASPHKIAISYDDDEDGIVRKLFPQDQFRYEEKTWAYRGTAGDDSQAKVEGKQRKKTGREVLIMNY
jgi:DNA adenine methylase